MSAAQVLAVLGRPYHIESYKGRGIHNMDCRRVAEGYYGGEVTDTLNIIALLHHATADSSVHKCDNGDFHAADRITTLTYSRPVDRVGSYPMVWVHLDSTARVASVGVKQYTPYFFLEDDCWVYMDKDELAVNPGRHENMRRLFGR